MVHLRDVCTSIRRCRFVVVVILARSVQQSGVQGHRTSRCPRPPDGRLHSMPSAAKNSGATSTRYAVVHRYPIIGARPSTAAQGIEWVAAFWKTSKASKSALRGRKKAPMAFLVGRTPYPILRPVASQCRFIEGSSGQQPMRLLSVAAWSTHGAAIKRVREVLLFCVLRDYCWCSLCPGEGCKDRTPNRERR